MFYLVKMISGGLFSIILCKQSTINRDEEVGGGGAERAVNPQLSSPFLVNLCKKMMLDNYPVKKWSFDLVTAKRRCWPTVQLQTCL